MPGKTLLASVAAQLALHEEQSPLRDVASKSLSLQEASPAAPRFSCSCHWWQLSGQAHKTDDWTVPNS